MTQKDPDVDYQSPDSIRSEVFGHRLRGLDEDEVRDYLELVADQVQQMERELARRHQEVEELQAQNLRLREEVRTAAQTSPQAAALLSEAQRLADQLVEEAVQRARDLMLSARSQQRGEPPRPPRPAPPPPRRPARQDILGVDYRPGNDDSVASIYEQVWRIRRGRLD